MIATSEPTSRFELAGKRIFVAGHKGMVGSALMRRLADERCELVTVDRKTLDLSRQADVERWFAQNRPDGVIVAAARVGGILANSERPTQFLYENLMIGANVISAAANAGVEKLVFLGSSCIYPRMAPQPIDESQILAGPLEPTNEAYAVAKIASLMLAKAFNRQYGKGFVTCVPCNLYGPNDNFDLTSAHVLPALMRKLHDAKAEGRREVAIWGTGSPLREFMHVDDLADACVLLLREYRDPQPINVGTGEEVSIVELAQIIADIVEFDGSFVFDPSQPDGTPRKVMSSHKIRALGWRPRISLRDGIRATYHHWTQSQRRSTPLLREALLSVS